MSASPAERDTSAEGARTPAPAPPPPPSARPWDVLGRERLGDFGVFRVDRLNVRNPRTGEVLDRHVLDVPDWVNVIPFTPDGRIVMVEQYRFGGGILSLEFPAGTLEPGEDPVVGGLRELREETGYRPAAAERVADVFADPAIQGNLLHVVVARDCVLTHAPEQDEGEDVHVRLVTEAELHALIARGRIRHALAVTAWCLYQAARDRTDAPPQP